MSKEIYELKITISISPNPLLSPYDKEGIKKDIIKKIDSQLIDMAIKAVMDSSTKEQKEFFRSMLVKNESPIKIDVAKAVSEPRQKRDFFGLLNIERDYMVDVTVEVP
jgi:hypothetical protein